MSHQRHQTQGANMNEHLNSLRLRLSNERTRLAKARNQHEKKLRAVWIEQLEKEIQNELKHFPPEQLPDLTDEELLRQLDS